MSSLEVHELYRFYHRGDDEIAALRGVSITVRPREIVAIVGPPAAANQRCSRVSQVSTSLTADTSW